MKKVLVAVSLLFLFPMVMFADAENCYIEKSNTESYILNKGDTITVYFVTNMNSQYSLPNMANIKLYYNPYVFELLSSYNGFDYFLNDGWNSYQYDKYSSLINLEIRGSDLTLPLESNGSNKNITKFNFKVRDTASEGLSTIELIAGNDSYVQGINNDDGDLRSIYCNNSVLSYEISNKTISTNHIDANLSYLEMIGTDEEMIYMYPSFSPTITTYNIETDASSVQINYICASSGCEVDNKVYNLKSGNNIIKVTSKNGSEKVTYTFNVNKSNYNEQVYPLLKSLTILKYNTIETFDKYSNTYHIVVPSTEDSLLIDCETNSDSNKIKILNNENFATGENVVVINVSNDSITNKYYIIVNKTENTDDNKVPNIDETNKVIKESTVNNKIYILFAIGLSLFVVLYITFDIVMCKNESKEK